MYTKRRYLAIAYALVATLGVDGCAPSVRCADGECVCVEGAACDVPCDAPPCHLRCAGDNPSCSGACANGDCSCGPRSSCDFACGAPPCHVDCDVGAACAGVCANGTCTCAAGANCAFACDAPPCHVECAGANEQCDGVCANGSCHCGPGSVCDFTCASGPCHTSCDEGASCVVHCPASAAGTAACDIVACDGAVTVCPDGATTTCGAPCP